MQNNAGVSENYLVLTNNTKLTSTSIEIKLIVVCTHTSYIHNTLSHNEIDASNAFDNTIIY